MNVLLVEDDAAERETLVAWLAGRGHDVRTAADAASGWRAFTAAPPPLMLVNLLPGGGTGHGLCRRVRAHPDGRDCIVLAVTERQSPEALREALDAGADDLLPKPLDETVFDLRMTIAEDRVRSRRERSEQAAALRTSEQRFRELVDHIHEVFWIASPDRREILYISPAVRDVWGTLPAEVYRDPSLLTRFVHPDDRDPVLRQYPLPDGARVASMEYRLEGTDHRVRHIRERAFPICDREGAVRRLVGVSEDITEAREAEEANRRDRQRQMELSQRTSRLASLGLLAAGVAHEVNNPLQGMMSHLRQARRNVPDDSEAAASLAMVERGIRTVAELVDKMLVLGRVPGNRAETSSFADSIDFVLQLLSGNLARRNIAVRQSGDAGARQATLRLPRAELAQVLTNLVVNACDAMPGGGTIDIGCAAAGEHAVLRVSDTGPGIPPDQLEQIFTPFYTSKGPQGVGLGLSITESIVRQCGGEITVTSEVGEGTTFVVRLPLAAPARPAEERVP